MAERAPVVVIGVGNALRHDDAAGLEVARRLRSQVDPSEVAALEQEGEPLALLDMWEGAAAVVLVDAVHSGAQPGTIHRVDASAEPIPVELRSSSSTHAIGVGEAIELARALHRLPGRVVVYGVEGRCFDAGSGLSEEVQAVIPALAVAVLGEACELC
ncbi:MAG TPA: hydrogenase maturation protease [Solirubrobacteraceae bacterium]|nr:hydrogenase maturation protease [Solirubrobacteraceae bacterium]